MKEFLWIIVITYILQTHAYISKPVILFQPKDTVVIGFSFTLMCITHKNNTVRWFHNGKVIYFNRRADMQRTSDGSLYVSNAVLHRDQGFYQCLVSNPRGSVFSRRAKVTFPYLRQFASGNAIIGKEESHSVVLSCQAPDAFPDRQIQWSKIDPQNQGLRKPLPQSPYYTVSANGDLHFSFVKSSDSGDYICTVTNNIINKHVVRTVVLNVMPVSPLVNQPPMIAPEFSVPKVAIKGQSFVLECIVYGMPVPKITIRMKGIHMLLGQITGNARRYFIKNFSSNDAGKYKCKASDVSGRIDARSTTIRMEAKPEWKRKPRDMTSGINSNATLPCRAFGIPRVHYQWYFNGKALKSSAKYSFNKGNLTITSLQYLDGGMYQCVVTNKHGQLLTSAELTVAETAAGFGQGSKFPEPIVNKLVSSDVMLTCNPTGNPKPIVRWKKGGIFVPKNTHYRFLKNGNLMIYNVTKKDSGKYTCVVTNRLGSDSRSGRLNVQENLAITSPPKDQTAIIGSSVRFTCGVTTMGVMEVTIQWSRYYIPIIPNTRVTVGKIGQDLGFLNIDNVQFNDGGLYSCKVTAPLGSKLNPSSTSSSAFSMLQVQGPPGPPTDVTILPKTNKGYYINVTWALGRDNNSPITSVQIEQNVDFEPDSWTLAKTIDDPSQTQVELPLSPWAQYSFRAIAINAIGRGTPSKPSPVIVTPSNAPDAVPKKIRSKGRSPTQMLITWKALSLIDQNGPGIYYIVYYKEADSDEKMHRHEVHNNKTRFMVRGSDYFVKYAFQIQAANQKGFGPKSKVFYGYSGERYPVGMPTQLKVRISSPTSAYATWTPVADTRDIAGGKLLGYKVYFWSEDKDYRPRKASYKSVIRNKAMLELEAYTEYRFQVVAYNSRGDGPGSNIVGPIRTPMAKSGDKTGKRESEPIITTKLPDPPTHLTLIVQNSSYVILQWGRPKKSNGIISSYRVSVRRLVDSKTVSGATNYSTQLRVHNLDLQTRYQFSVRAINRIGQGPPVMADFDLAIIPLSWPKDVSATYDEFQREASIKWSKVLKPAIDGYRVFYWGRDRIIKYVDVERDRTERTIPRLIKGSDYHFQVAAFRLIDGEHYGIGPRSPPVKAGRVVTLARTGNSGPSIQPSVLFCVSIFCIVHWLTS